MESGHTSDDPPGTTIRRAGPADCEGICASHLASIRGVCSRDYSPAEIESWCVGKTPEVYAPLIDQYIWFVAERDGRVVGFGELDPAADPERQGAAEVRGLYIAPEAIGQGVGRAIMRRLLDEARAAGVSRVVVKGTLTAEPFYRRTGFRVVERTTYRTRGGLDVASVSMEMTLQ